MRCSSVGHSLPDSVLDLCVPPVGAVEGPAGHIEKLPQLHTKSMWTRARAVMLQSFYACTCSIVRSRQRACCALPHLTALLRAVGSITDTQESCHLPFVFVNIDGGPDTPLDTPTPHQHLCSPEGASGGAFTPFPAPADILVPLPGGDGGALAGAAPAAQLSSGSGPVREGPAHSCAAHSTHAVGGAIAAAVEAEVGGTAATGGTEGIQQGLADAAAVRGGQSGAVAPRQDEGLRSALWTFSVVAKRMLAHRR